MNKIKIPLLAIFLIALLSACGGGQAAQTRITATPAGDTATPPEVDTATLEAALPTASGPSNVATTAQPAATLPPVFDLTRTEDNPITDARQIIEILEALENVQRAQPIPPGWYLRTSINLLNPDNPGHIHDLYHVVDEDLNCDLAMDFVLNPNKAYLGFMTRNYGTPLYASSAREIIRMEGAEESYLCHLSNPNLWFFSNDSDEFSLTIQGWSKPGAEQWGDYSFSAWFENEDDQTLFVLQEGADNMRLAYRTDPDTQELVAMRSRVEKTTYSVDTGRLIGNQSTAILANNKTSNSASLIQLAYYPEMDELPPSVLAYLEESLRTYDELQLP